ncbi:hypothetical protein [Nitrosomonas sp. Nm166]|uniref:hypothetical protein n=1 Tax=Nitrosomonas sp. Nm166 TaxID=1881054 RepID=UPI000B832224|nr:hypothetical protein [Nitrosomonas sp. Nm166]
MGLTPQQAHMQAFKILHYASEWGDKAYNQHIRAEYCQSEEIEVLMHRVLSTCFILAAYISPGSENWSSNIWDVQVQV